MQRILIPNMHIYFDCAGKAATVFSYFLRVSWLDTIIDIDTQAVSRRLIKLISKVIPTSPLSSCRVKKSLLWQLIDILLSGKLQGNGDVELAVPPLSYSPGVVISCTPYLHPNNFKKEFFIHSFFLIVVVVVIVVEEQTITVSRQEKVV